MTELDRIHKMPIDEMTNSLVRILTCKRCFCQDICKEIKETTGADGKAPCAVAIKQYLMSEAKTKKGAKNGCNA